MWIMNSLIWENLGRCTQRKPPMSQLDETFGIGWPRQNGRCNMVADTPLETKKVT